MTQPVGVKIAADANISTAAASTDPEQEEENESGDMDQAVATATTPPTTASTAVVHRVVAWGGLCGEIAIATQEPYVHSVVARG